jgi:predicted Zn finger-like uncharacterized protein
MYTQCPDCSTAFRVTAEVLKKAAGKVRCGGCGHAFNALEYLSETMPERRAPKEAREDLPELRPEPLEADDDLPKSISAEQSAALLKTLDQLAGSDIRIEDTGVEWRVLDDDELGEAADDAIAEDVDVQDQPEIDEILEDSPTPVDQFLTDTPPEVDAPEIFEEEANEPARTPVEELRFDDNTPLPEDFDVDAEAPYAPEPDPEPVPEPEPEADIEVAAQPDLDLSEPDEWTDILDEFEELAEAVSEPISAEELEALGSDDEPEPEEEPEPGPETEPTPDLFAQQEQDEDAEEVAATSGDQPLDMDTQFALQAEAMGIDLSGINEAPEVAEEAEIGEEVDLEALLEETQRGDLDLDDLLEEEMVDDATTGDLEFELEPEIEAEAAEEPEEDEELDEQKEPDEDEEPDEREEPDEEVLEVAPEDEPPAEHVVPPMSEEEQTINMQIDQDLLALAVTDEDGFASTIVIPEDQPIEEVAEKKSAKEAADDDEFDSEQEQALRDTSAGFETIIMEGEHIRTAMEQDRREADREAAAASLVAAAAAAREAEKAARGGKRNWGMIAGAIVLVLLLVAQGLHQARNTLATIPAFNNVVAPMYRALGKPLSPDWDITGWRFEVTRGSTDEANENLTVYSRLGNKSDNPLPYPLIGISLTDRFEETIGSRVLDPADYLASDLDPRKLVEPGNTFNAVITIPSPSTDATGFKLNVCYRESGGDLRCAIDDFR